MNREIARTVPSTGCGRERIGYDCPVHPTLVPAVLSAPLLTFAAALALAACSSSNPLSECSGTTTTVTVSVIDDSNEEMHICDAGVTVTGPGTNLTLTPNGSNGTCDYVGNVGGTGKYTITATANGEPQPPYTQNIQEGCSISVALDVTPMP
jgi:hypothetical protein